MYGDDGKGGFDGIVPRVTTSFFSSIKAETSEDERIKYSVRCSFIEIYNDQVRDLLDAR
jgi:kinesin family protein 11